MNLLTTVYNFFSPKNKSTQDTPGWDVMGSHIPSFWPSNWWQKDLTAESQYHNSAVEACVGLYGRTVSMLPITHFKHRSDGGKDTITNSPVAKVLRKPNKYQTRADFFLNLVRAELFTGNGFAFALRDPEYNIRELHLVPPKSCSHYVDPDDRSIYYYISGNDLVDMNLLAPARDILNVRMASGSDLLKGETPLMSGLLAASAGTSIQQHNSSFFRNMSRPSGTLNTDLELDKEQTAGLRQRWEEQSAGLNAGKTPVLSHGLKWSPLSVTANDAEMIEFYKLTVTDIARVFGVPQALIGDMESSTFGNVETLLRQWVSVGLGYMVDHLELALHDLFDLPEDESLNFDLDYLLRGNLEDRMEAYSKGIMGGIYSINEARAKEGLQPVEAGDEPRLQMQVVGLTYYQEQLDMDKERLEMDKERLEMDKTKDKEVENAESDLEVITPDDSKTIQNLIQKAMV